MLLYYSIALTGFVYYTIRFWVLHGARIPLIFIAFWVLGRVCLPEPHIFMGYQAVLALTLAIINGYCDPPLG